jgi:Uma2 family endonuclease
MATTLTPVSAVDFEHIAAVLGSCELVQGEVMVMAPGGFDHSRVTANWVILLGSWNRVALRGRVLTNEAGIVVSRDPDTVRGADALFISYERLPRDVAHRGYLTVPPELVVEVLGHDESWSHIETKIAEYHTLGVDLVWVADPHTRTVRAYPRGAEPRVLPLGETLDGGTLLPGFSCEVAELFATS